MDFIEAISNEIVKIFIRELIECFVWKTNCIEIADGRQIYSSHNCISYEYRMHRNMRNIRLDLKIV